MAKQANSLCALRDISRAILAFEEQLRQRHNLCLNEGMLLCSLAQQQRSCGELAEALGLTSSNTSKVIKSVEDKGYVKRMFGASDKRLMFFALTPSGKAQLRAMQAEEAAFDDVLANIRKSAKAHHHSPPVA